MKIVRIKRSEWACGSPDTDTEDSCMFDPDSGRLCCLGHISLAAGVSKESMMQHLTPTDVWHNDHDDTAKLVPEWMLESVENGCENTPETQEMMCINDDNGMTDAHREKTLKEHAAAHGVILEFEGEWYESEKQTV